MSIDALIATIKTMAVDHYGENTVEFAKAIEQWLTGWASQIEAMQQQQMEEAEETEAEAFADEVMEYEVD